MLTPVQREALVEIISSTLDDGGQIPWRKMVQSSTFANITYDTLRREGKVVLRQLKAPRNKPIKRRIDQISAEVVESEPFVDQERITELEVHKQMKALQQQVENLTASIDEKNKQLAEEEKTGKQMQYLQQCISELSAIIANKDKLLAEANARYDALKEGLEQLVSDQ
ncbi:hypothetical protein PHMEG_00010330 [Phytophthora megakarya]|uniref:Uncharacterized protein n=1 Tax=Phytophthora megakarya TaxID=4795 RepID=A0A225WDY6_9STRA|nr:hypothetical protein PHMEG_00010330 [Phytophthora megakarya]